MVYLIKIICVKNKCDKKGKGKVLVKKMKKYEWALETCLAQTRQKRVGGVGQITLGLRFLEGQGP